MTQITKVGHFYMAQLGHYHVAATGNLETLTKKFRCDRLIIEIEEGLKNRFFSKN